jgi:two-component system chemotaxis response regulator CheB
MMVKSHGGTVIVQDPHDAVMAGMPTSALQRVQADEVLTARDIGRYLSARSTGRFPGGGERSVAVSDEADIRMIQQDFTEQAQDQRAGQLTMFTCPDCGGSLWQSLSAGGAQFRCHVGHVWGPESLLGHKSEELEAALWMSVRLLEERATLSRQVAARMRSTDASESHAGTVEEQADLDERRADSIRDLLHAPLHVALQMLDTAAGSSEPAD